MYPLTIVPYHYYYISSESIQTMISILIVCYCSRVNCAQNKANSVYHILNFVMFSNQSEVKINPCCQLETIEMLLSNQEVSSNYFLESIHSYKLSEFGFIFKTVN